MRPRKLELEGFASFREHTEIDFEGADLFALTGPTGAGKSSILDAMVFCLYGLVPRYDDKGVVWPVISQGKNEAKVRLDFSVGGQDYSAVRVVRRTAPNRATTKEAILECGGEYLTKSADELTKKVEEVLGLSFDQFTRCVMLPQGAFAQFLHDKGRDKNELLRQLLGADLYRRLFNLASQELAALENDLTFQNGRLKGFADATAETFRQLELRAKELDELQIEVEKIHPALEKVGGQIQTEEGLEEENLKSAFALQALKEPAGLRELAAILERHKKGFESASEELDTATEWLAACEQELSRMPNLEELHAQHKLYEALDNVNLEISAAEGESKQARITAGDHKVRLAAAEGEFASVEERLAKASQADTAFDLASRLKPGDACPVCGGVFHGAVTETPSDIKRVQAERMSANSALVKARRDESSAAAELAACERTHDLAGLRLERITKSLEGVPPLVEVLRLGKATRAATEAAKHARESQTVALKAQQSAQKQLHDSTESAEGAKRDLAKTSRSLSAFEPPLVDDSDLSRAWSEFLAWARERAAGLVAEAEASRQRMKELEARRGAVARQLIELAEPFGIAEAPDRIRDACVRAHDRADVDAERCKVRLREKAKLMSEVEVIQTKRDTMGSLKGQLQTNRFEAWVLNRSFRLLCQAASQKLRELSNGQYSIEVNDSNEFEIVDHVNADERRSVRTLSGGETFLASLSLALSLADQVVSQSAGAAKLDSLFLDEGFGTLDPDTLAVVRDAVEELASTGRMIGLITHVHELAEGLPRFVVRKTERGSRVEKVPV